LKPAPRLEPAPGRATRRGRGFRLLAHLPGFWIIFAVALAVRLAYLLQVRGTPVTDVLLIDSDTYDRFARLILAGRFHGEEVYSMNLLYPHFLAGLYALTGGAVFPVLVVQAVLSALNAGFIFLLGRRFFDARTAWVAGLAAAFYAPYVFYAGALLTPTLIESCGLLALLALAAWRTSPRARLLVVAGLCTGLAALGRGSGMLFVPLALPFFRIECGSWRGATRGWAVFATGALALTGLATLRNAGVEGRFVPISANYAAFYLGHHSGANGLYTMPDFVSTAAFEGEVTGVRAALSRELGRELSQAEASSELFRRGLRWAAAHPREELSLAARKFYYFWNRTESPTNLSLDFAREFSWVLRALPPGFGIIAPLGIAGLLAARRRWREHTLLLMALLVPLVTCVVFFVSAEYRLPAAAVLLLFAAHAVTRGFAWLARPRDAAGRRAAPAASPRDGWLALALLPLLFIACNIRTPLLRAQSLNRVAFYNYGVLYAQKGQSDIAEALLKRSLAVDPGYAPALEALAGIESRRGNNAEAMRYMERARPAASRGLAVSPSAESNEDRLRVEAEALYQAGRFEEALATFEQARTLYAAVGQKDPELSMSNNIGLTLYKLGRLTEAELSLRALIAAEPGYVRAHTNLALVYEKQGRTREAETEYRRALDIEPKNRRAREALERIARNRAAR
jgi:tetratricopeptide (TPR) repeat protein